MGAIALLPVPMDALDGHTWCIGVNASRAHMPNAVHIRLKHHHMFDENCERGLQKMLFLCLFLSALLVELVSELVNGQSNWSKLSCTL